MLRNNRARFQTPPQNQGTQVKLQDHLNLINYNDLCPAFLFSATQRKFCLSSWEKNRIKVLIDKLSMLESKTWNEIIRSNILHFKQVDKSGLKVSIPPEVTADTQIFYFRADDSHRVFGYKERHNFKFLWFDKEHKVYPGQYR